MCRIVNGSTRMRSQVGAVRLGDHCAGGSRRWYDATEPAPGVAQWPCGRRPECTPAASDDEFCSSADVVEIPRRNGLGQNLCVRSQRVSIAQSGQVPDCINRWT